MGIDFYTVSQVAKAIGVSPPTVRAYTRDYPDHLSEHATPPQGQERQYTNDDIRVLQTIRILKQQKKKATAIESVLASGQRMEPPDIPDQPADDAPDAEKKTKTDDTTALATVDLLDRFIVRYEERIDQLEEQLTESNEARRLAEVEAAELRGKLEERDRRPWYRRIFRGA